MKRHLQHIHLDQPYVRHKLVIDGLAWKQTNLLLMKPLVFVETVFLASTKLKRL